MVRSKVSEGIHSDKIVAEVEKRPCLYDTSNKNYGDRMEKNVSWDEVYENVVPGWCTLGSAEKFAAGKEVQKRWRSIRDSFTKSYRQGKIQPDQCQPGSRRYQYHKQMSFLLRALQNKKPRYSQEKYESFSEVSNSPQHPPPEDIPRLKNETPDKPLDLQTRPNPEKYQTNDKSSQASCDPIEIKIDANTILPGDHFNDDRMFMNSLLPLFKKMDDDTRLLCRIEVLKIMRYALQGHKSFETSKMSDDKYFKEKVTNILSKDDSGVDMSLRSKSTESTLSMTTRSADGSRPIRKRRVRSPSPLPVPPKKRGPGRPRKVRPPPSDSDEDQHHKKQFPKLKVSPVEVTATPEEESYNTVTSIAQLPMPLFMKMYNLARSNIAPALTAQVSIKAEPMDETPSTPLSN